MKEEKRSKFLSVILFSVLLSSGDPFFLLDVRNRTQYAICSLSHSHNIPLSELSNRMADVEKLRELEYERSQKNEESEKVREFSCHFGRESLYILIDFLLNFLIFLPQRPIYVMCRRGVASLSAVSLLRSAGLPAVNVDGGLVSWKQNVDISFPLY